MKKIIAASFFAISLAACRAQPPFTRVTYDAGFSMATCGNILNPAYYSPSKGPEGFVDYRFYFTKGFFLQLNRDFSAALSFTTRESPEETIVVGRYASASANSGVLRFSFEANQEIEFFWLNYYELYFSWTFVDVVSGDTVTAVSLLHGVNIFSA